MSLALNTLYLGNRKYVGPCFYRITETRVEVWENEKWCMWKGLLYFVKQNERNEICNDGIFSGLVPKHC